LSRGLPRRALLRAGGALATLPPLVLGAELGAAAWLHGPEYVRRLLWSGSRKGEAALFPARTIAPAAVPFRFAPPAGSAAAAVRAGYARVAARRGLSGVDLDRTLAESATTGFAVIKDDRLLYEGYFGGRTRESEQASFSVAKSVVALLIGAAIGDGLLPSVDTPAEALLSDIPGLRGSGITLRHLLRMSAGFAYRGGPRRASLGEFLLGPFSHTRLLTYAPDLRRVAAGVEPAYPPGTRFAYDGRCTQLLGMVLERAAGEPVADYLARRLWRPMGAEFPASWSLDSEASGLERLESGLNARTLDFAKFGRLVLRRGDWDGTRLLPTHWIDAATAPPENGHSDYYGPGLARPAGMPSGYYGFHWWGFERPGGHRVPFAAGSLGQFMLVHPATSTVIVRNGDGLGRIDHWPALLCDLAEELP
jgi:CubicO group peptidase (beta-lactamase class C family)